MGFFSDIAGKSLFFVGIKGTGMSRLAVLLSASGARVTGSDVPMRFSTDADLTDARIRVLEDSFFSPLPDGIDMVIHSAAYGSKTNRHLREAEERGIPTYSYPRFLGLMSKSMHTFGVAGTHGKTTASGCLDWILRKTSLPYVAVYGSHILHERTSRNPSGDSFAVLEACEYRDHFLNYDLDGVLVTTVEHDHPDWFAGERDVLESFKRLILRLPDRAPVVCGIDSELCRELAGWVAATRPMLDVITYGVHPDSMFRVGSHEDSLCGSTYILYPLEGHQQVKVASLPLCLDVVGACLLGAAMLLREHRGNDFAHTVATQAVLQAMLAESASFPGCAGRVELLFEEDGIAYVDDYAHHPTEIAASLENLRSRFAGRRLVTIFFPHTLSRTRMFFDGFVASLSRSDLPIIRPVFASARSDGDQRASEELARLLAERTGGLFFGDEHSLCEVVAHLLHPCDVCVTMGAGNNSGLARKIADRRRSSRC